MLQCPNLDSRASAARVSTAHHIAPITERSFLQGMVSVQRRRPIGTGRDASEQLRLSTRLLVDDYELAFHSKWAKN